MIDPDDWLAYLKRMQAMAKTGLTYAKDPYDIERYEEMRDSTNRLLAAKLEVDEKEIQVQFNRLDDDYPTPKIDVRALVQREGRILLVQENCDGMWAMPGGWCDIGFSPAENVVKEVREEAGLQVQVKRVLAVWDKARQDHPPDLRSVYKLVFECHEVGGRLQPGHEVGGADFFEPKDLPPLSLTRTTALQVRRLLEMVRNQEPPDFD